MDATGLSTCNHVRWYDHKWGRSRSATTGSSCTPQVLTNVITAVEVADKEHDTRFLIPMLQRHSDAAATAENFTLREVSADKAYSSKANLQAISDAGATPFIPFREFKAGANPRGTTPSLFDPKAVPPPANAPAWDRMYHFFAQQRDTFLSHYHRRSNVETTFSVIKRKFGGSLRSKSEGDQRNEVLCKVIAHNVCCLISAITNSG